MAEGQSLHVSFHIV